VRRAVLFPTLLVLLAGAASARAQTFTQAARPEDVGVSSERLQRLKGALDGYVSAGLLPGGVALVAREGRVVLHHAFGQRDREARDAMAPDDLFRIASQTKALVSLAILMLQEDGKLLIGDPVSKYLPAFARTTVAVPRSGGGYDVVDAKRPITLRDLLTHTAGIGYGTGVAKDRWEAAGITGWYFAHRDEPVRATVDRMASLPMDAQPGEKYVYGYNTDILGAVVEAVSGLTLDAFLRSQVFEPLGMRDTHFYVPRDKAGRLVTVYSVAPGGLVRAPDGAGMQAQGQYVDGPRVSFSGGAGVISTAADYARFLQMLLNGGTLDGARLLAPSSVALMTTDHVGTVYGVPGMGFGLGFSVVEDVGARGTPGSVGEYGWGGAYHSTYWVDPAEKLVVVYLTQVIPATGLDDFGKLRALVYQALTGPAR
jgi:CubicO group peptidase (beta-lactamase class C family)